MKTKRIHISAARLLATAMLAVVGLARAPSASAAPVVSAHLKIPITAAGATLQDLFTNMPSPDPCAPAPCTDQRVMVAKFVVDEPADLSFELRATTITKYPVTPFTTAGGGATVSVTDADTGTQAVTVQARFLADPAMAGWRILRILMRFDNAYDGFPAGEKWTIQVNKKASDRHFVGFRVDGAVDLASTAGTNEGEQLVTKPQLIKFIADGLLTSFGSYVDLSDPASVNFGQVHIQLPATYIPDQQYEFRNVGTGPLTITAANPISLPAGGTFAFTYPSIPASVDPMNGLHANVTFQPTAPGPATTVNVTFTTNAGDKHVNLSGQGITLRSAMLLDISGSMNADKNGNFGAPAEQQKIYNARIAGLELAELYNSVLPKARLGLYTYPNVAASCPGSDQLINLSQIDTNIQAYRNRLNVNLGHADLIHATNGGETPMAEGIKRVWGVLVPKPADTLAAVFQIGDGQHSYGNCDSAAPHRTPEEWFNDPAFATAKVPFFTIPYGAMFQGSPTTAQFQQVASHSRTEAGDPGFMFPADITDDTALQTQFTKALGKALNLETLLDPKANINVGGTAIHSVCVTESSQQVVFSVHWAIKNAAAVAVTIETPDHTLLTPASPAANPGHVSYTPGDTFADYVVRGKYLAGNAGSGVWKIHVKGNQATSYVYQVQAQDRIQTQPKIKWGHVGQLANLELAFQDLSAAPIVAASITGRYEAPSASFNNYLATTPITPEMLAQIPSEKGEHMSLAEKKYYALVNYAKKPFNVERVSTEFRMGDEAVPIPPAPNDPPRGKRKAAALPPEPETLMARAMITRAASTTGAPPTTGGATGAKVYTQNLPVAKFDGVQQLAVNVIGATALGECFQRQFVTAAWADIALTAVLVKKAIRLEEAVTKPFFPPPLTKILQAPVAEGRARKSVTFTPTDEAGNFFGVGRAAEISFSLSGGAEALGAVVDNLDGSYTQVLEYAKTAQPVVSVAVGDVSTGPVPVDSGGTGSGGGGGPGIPLIVLLILLALVIITLLLRKKKPSSP